MYRIINKFMMVPRTRSDNTLKRHTNSTVTQMRMHCNLHTIITVTIDVEDKSYLCHCEVIRPILWRTLNESNIGHFDFTVKSQSYDYMSIILWRIKEATVVIVTNRDDFWSHVASHRLDVLLGCITTVLIIYL